jgi:hypothetical protein
MSIKFKLALVLLLVALPQRQDGAQSAVDLPADLTGYQDWKQLLTSPIPYRVPIELWIRCVAPTPADWAEAREKNGPHNERYIRVYGNPSATRSLANYEKRFPVGSVIAKEKFTTAPDGPAVGLAFMIKREVARFPETDGWEFVYYPASGDARKTHEACAACHRRAASTDYLFGQYPR